MKAKTDDLVITLEDVPSDFSDRIIPKGSHGVIVECYFDPEEGYCVDLAIPDDSMIGDNSYENVILRPSQFTVLTDPVEMTQSMKEQVLRLIGEHDGQWGWYQLDRHLSTHVSPPGRDLMTSIEDLIREGLIEDRAAAGTQPRYFLTDLGRARIETNDNQKTDD